MPTPTYPPSAGAEAHQPPRATGAYGALPARDLSPLPPVGRTLVGGFESTYLPAFGVDGIEASSHDRHRDADLDSLLDAGVRHLRYPLRWHRIETEPGTFDWRETDRVLGRVREAGAVVILDLVHHTSYPDWLSDGFRGPDFGPAFVHFAEAVATRYPWLPAYTLLNEPFTTFFFTGQQALWPPYDRGVEGFVRSMRSVMPALAEAAQCWRDLLPAAHHVWVDTAEHHRGTGLGIEAAAFANDRRYLVLDLALGRHLDPSRPSLLGVLGAGGESLLDLPPLQVDVLGLDYYCHSEWFYDDHGGQAPSPHPVGFAEIAAQYGDRYGLPMMLAETNLRGLPTDRVAWLRHTLEEYELALGRGVALHGYCWFPQVDSCDWDTLLARCRGRADPVGVLDLAADGSRVETSFTAAWRAAASGAPVESLPAYRLQSPNDRHLAGFLPALSHWPWQDPPAGEVVPAIQIPDPDERTTTMPTDVTPTDVIPTDVMSTDVTPTVAMPGGSTGDALMTSADLPTAGDLYEPDLVVLSHLRWAWVWQRPQHLVSRMATWRAARGARTWFVEEPSVGDVDEPVLRTEQHGPVTRVWLVVPRVDDGSGNPDLPEYQSPVAEPYGDLLRALLAEAGRPAGPDVWIYTPMAFDLAQRLDAGRLVYDVMDDLSAFLDAPQGLALRQRRLMAEADVVFTGGRSLHRVATTQRHHDIHLFPSGVETAHYATARALRAERVAQDRSARRVAGYVGVFDERIDLDLVRDLAGALPDWTIRIVGPLAKIDPSSVPQASNLEYAGLTAYADLPARMAGFDVALMPFALNEATRSISPTKTLEYFAAGLPVVSTRVADVVADYGSVVSLADDSAGFAAACRSALQSADPDRERRVRRVLARQEWDAIAARMVQLLDAATGRADQDLDRPGRGAAHTEASA